jgi:predicted nicotinamide N-methyase
MAKDSEKFHLILILLLLAYTTGIRSTTTIRHYKRDYYFVFERWRRLPGAIILFCLVSCPQYNALNALALVSSAATFRRFWAADVLSMKNSCNMNSVRCKHMSMLGGRSGFSRCDFFSTRVSVSCNAIPPTRSVTEERIISSYATDKNTSMKVNSAARHIVDGIECTEIAVSLPLVGNVKIIEATAKSQDVLVDMALALDDGATTNNETTEARSNSSNAENEGVTTLYSGDPYGAVLWPSARNVAKYLLSLKRDDAENSCLLIKDSTILEIGTGTGLVSIAAALGGAKHVIATDYERIPLTLLGYAATTLNGIQCRDDHYRHGRNISAAEEVCNSDTSLDNSANKNNCTITTQLLDLRNLTEPLPPADIVVAADVLYEPATGVAVAHRAAEAYRRGSRFIIGDSPGRPGRISFVSELKRIAPDIQVEFVDAVGHTCVGERNDLICGEGSQSVSLDEPIPLTIAILDIGPK